MGRHLLARDRSAHEIRWLLAAGVFAGLATLTKLTGGLIVVAATLVYVVDGWLSGETGAGVRRAVVLGLTAVVVGGWYYGRNLVQYGYVYPHALEKHSLMLEMPPGERSLVDYVHVPLATWTESKVNREWLLHSVWGGTYATLWYDGHRRFLPKRTPLVDEMGTAILILALVPVMAFGVGLARGVRRALVEKSRLDALLIAVVGVTLAGYVYFTWRNPWYVTVKGSYLLGLSLPFAYYASEVLADWTRGRSPRAIAIWCVLIALWVSIVLVFDQGLLFEKVDLPR